MSAPAVNADGVIDDPLTDAEYDDLEKLETTISKGLDTFVEVGNALAEIRDRKLYRQYFTSFAAYCEQQWDMGKSQAYRLIDAADVVASLAETSPNGDTPLPSTESQARALSEAAPEHRAETMRKASADGPPTAPKIREAAAEVDPLVAERRRQQDERDRAKAEKAAREKAAKDEADAVMKTRIAERREHDPRVRADHINNTVRGFLLSEAHTLLDIHPREAAESIPLGDEESTLADADRLATWLADFHDYVTEVATVTDIRSVK